MKNGGRSVVDKVSEIEITGRISKEMITQRKKRLKNSDNNPDTNRFTCLPSRIIEEKCVEFS